MSELSELLAEVKKCREILYTVASNLAFVGWTLVLLAILVACGISKIPGT